MEIHVKWLLGIGLGLAFLGVWLIVRSRVYKSENGQIFYDVHGPILKGLNVLGQVLIGVGFVLQVIGIILS